MTIIRERMDNSRTSSDGQGQGFDFSILRARDIRDVLKSKAHCLMVGFPASHVIIQTLNEMRDYYARHVGLATYLSQMLGPLGNVPIQHCTLYNEGEQRLPLHLNGNHNQPLQRFIASHFEVETLPFKVVVQQDQRTDTRYL